MSAHHHDVSRDKGPAFLGLLVGMIFLGAVVYGMVQWTNARFEGHGAGEKAAAAATAKH